MPSLRRQGQRGAAASERQLVVFSLHGEEYGLPIDSVREIIRYTPPRATAAASGLVKGMISLRGRVLPVVDLSSRLGNTLEITSKTKILVVELARGSVALIVDAVEGILQLQAEQIEPLPVAAGDSRWGDEIAVVGERLIIVIDPEQAMGSALPAPRRRTSE